MRGSLGAVCLLFYQIDHTMQAIRYGLGFLEGGNGMLKALYPSTNGA